MTVEMEFSTDRAYDNTPEFRRKAYGGPPSDLVSGAGRTPDEIRTRITVNKIVVAFEGITLPDLSSTTEDNFVTALEGNIPNCVHHKTREVPR